MMKYILLGSVALLLSLPLSAQDQARDQDERRAEDDKEFEQFKRIIQWVTRQLEEDERVQDELEDLKLLWRMMPQKYKRLQMLRSIRLLEAKVKVARETWSLKINLILARGYLPREPEFLCRSCRVDARGPRCIRCGRRVVKRKWY